MVILQLPVSINLDHWFFQTLMQVSNRIIITDSKVHFINDIWLIIRIRKNVIVLLEFLSLSLQNYAHATTAQLSWHVHNFVATTLSESVWEQNEISLVAIRMIKNRQ